MSYTPPPPPQELSTDTIEQFDDFPPELLCHVADYAEELAEYREREARLAEHEDEENQIEEQPGDLQDDVPSKATITVKEITDNRYYWQWREGGLDQIEI